MNGLVTENKEQEKSGGRVVNMIVKDDTDFLSVFSESETPVISGEVAEFIENRTMTMPPKELLTLKIHSDCIDENEKKLYTVAIKEYYSEKYLANKRELKRNNIIVLLLMIAGIIALSLRIILEYTTNSLIWTEIIDIAAWVFLWEAVDISVFGNKALRFKNKHYLSYMSMNVEYVELSEK